MRTGIKVVTLLVLAGVASADYKQSINNFLRSARTLAAEILPAGAVVPAAEPATKEAVVAPVPVAKAPADPVVAKPAPKEPAAAMDPAPATKPAPADAAAPKAVDPAALEAVQAAFTKNLVFPEVLEEFVPTVDVSVAYGATPVELGAQVLPADGAKAPVITLTGTKVGTKYTVLMTDPGVLNAAPAGNAWQWLHWITVNNDSKLTKGVTVMPYSGPNPPAGNHRYVVLVFQQAEDIKPATPQERGAFDTRAFIKENGLTPVGGFMYYSTN